MSLMYVLWKEGENRKSGKTDFNAAQNDFEIFYSS